MGLDNEFRLRNRSGDLNITIAAFSNYRELNDYARQYFSWNNRKHEEAEVVCEVNSNQIKELLNYIEPVAATYMKYSDDQLSYYDDNGYPKSLIMKHYNNNFSPADSRSSFSYYKMLKLYRSLFAILEIMNNNSSNDDLYFDFISSY